MLKKKLLFLATLPTSFLFISCSGIYNFYESQPKPENKSLLTNLKFQEFVNSVFSNNELQKDDYISNQINLNLPKLTSELKYSLIFSRPYFRFFKDQYTETRENSRFTIHSYLSRNWLFLLENIDKLSFIFNPYTGRFVKNANEEKINLLKDNKIKITNKNFDFVKIDREADQFDKNSVYYLIFDKNKFIRFTVFETNNELKTKLDYNMFVLEDQIADNFSFANAIENWVKSEEQKYFKDKLETARENLTDDFRGKKAELEDKIARFKRSSGQSLDSEDEEDEDGGGNFCSLENLDACSEQAKAFLLGSRNRRAFGRTRRNVSVTNFQDLDTNSDQNNSSQEISDANLELAELEEKYKNDLANLDNTVKNQLFNEKNDLTSSNFFSNITTDISSFNSPYKFHKYSLYSIDLEKGSDISTKPEESPKKNSSFMDNYSKFIDEKLDIKIKNETAEEFNNRRVFEFIFQTIWPNNENKKVQFFNTYYAKENIEKLEAEWKKIQEKLNNTDSEDFEAAIEEYKNFVDTNWLFILERLDKLRLDFYKWYSFPDQFNEDGSIKVAHSDEFKQLVKDQEDLTEPFYYANKYLESISEGDTSRFVSNYKDLYILKQNTLINLRVDNSGSEPKVSLNPFVYHFPKTKNKISAKVLTEIFHQALYHASQEAYHDFENDFVKKFRYNLPAQMFFKEKDEKK
ncbi:aromatic motif membrane protein [Mesomycoplasma ovipneumoniae]|uniref:aromatic motif membrane protein n=1 Tax=Mesomycoplasma ovipneumoniae TaxID=29562 RepID=UPI00307FFCA4